MWTQKGKLKTNKFIPYFSGNDLQIPKQDRLTNFLLRMELQRNKKSWRIHYKKSRGVEWNSRNLLKVRRRHSTRRAILLIFGRNNDWMLQRTYSIIILHHKKYLKMAERKKWLIDAVLAVMEECKNVDKNLDVWTWRSSYKWVSDKDVKVLVGQSMRKHWLVIFPIKIEDDVEVTQREAKDNYWNTVVKKSYHTKVRVTYLLKHKSGESQEIVGYWHGVDSQDKGAWKATTYALKYTLLYTFLVATGSIDDSDNTHSEDVKKPENKKSEEKKQEFTQERFDKLVERAEWKSKEEVEKELTKVKESCEIPKDIQNKIYLLVKTLK